MRRYAGLVVVAGLVALSGYGRGQAVATTGGILEVMSPQCMLTPQLFTEGWSNFQGGHVSGVDVEQGQPFKIVAADGGVVQGRARLTAAGAGRIRAEYTFVPDKDIRLNALFVGAKLAVNQWAGSAVKVVVNGQPSGSITALPVKHENTMLFNTTPDSLVISKKDTAERLEFYFDKPVQVAIQDDRQWGPSYSIRIGLQRTGELFRAGESYSFGFEVGVHHPLDLIIDGPVTITAGKEWVPLKLEADIAAGSALDFSQMGLHDAPAGKHGYVVARGPYFEFEKLPGKPQRFYGVNLSFSANYPDVEFAETMAVRLARTGYNALRLHHHDRQLVDGSEDTVTLNTDSIRRLDALVAACIRNGIYITTDLFVSRQVPWRTVGIDRDGIIAMNEYKILVAVHEGAFENLKSITRNFLNHVNPHTGRRYADEPALSWLALTNEGNFSNFLNEMQGIPEWQQQWATWLRAKKEQDPDAYRGVPESLPEGIYNDTPHVAAFVLFLHDVEVRFVSRMTSFLRDELKCRALITNRSSWINHASDQVTRNEVYDFVDDHFYVDHPQFIERPWRLPSRCPNINPLLGNDRGVKSVAFTRLLDKPFTITEYNFSGPGRFRGVGGILTGALGALQDWDGLWRYTYSHSDKGIMKPGNMGYFDMASDPLSLAAERAAICLFLRRDLGTLRSTFAMVLPRSKVMAMQSKVHRNYTEWPWIGWYSKLGSVVADQPPAGTTWSAGYPDVYKLKQGDVRELLAEGNGGRGVQSGDGSVELDTSNGSFVIKSSRTCGGFAEAGSVDAGTLSFTLHESAATVWVSSLDGRGIESSKRLLLTHLTDVQNTGIRYGEMARRTLMAWGGMPHLVRNGRADVGLKVGGGSGYRVYRISTGGQRLGEVDSSYSNGVLSFTAAVDMVEGEATIMYEVVAL